MKKNYLKVALVGAMAVGMMVTNSCKKKDTTPSFSNFTETGGGLSFDMVAVPGGTFTMGGTAEQGSDVLDRELPTHSVTLSNFSIGKYEVTQKLWYDVMGSYPGAAPSSSSGVGDNYPMYFVSWEDIVGTSGSIGYTEKGIDYYTNGFCYQLSVKVNGGTLGTKHYRLPTEAEWEYAARGGASSGGYTYSGSNTIDDVAWYDSNSGRKSHAVGTTPSANELGIYDMSGNVGELCSDWFGDYSSSAQTNPTGASEGSSRVARGGTWYGDEQYCRVAFRTYPAPDTRSFPLGFRLVLP